MFYSYRKVSTGFFVANRKLCQLTIVNAIIETTKPRIHYKVGASLQKFSIVLKRVLPDKVYERMLLNHYKLK